MDFLAGAILAGAAVYFYCRRKYYIDGSTVLSASLLLDARKSSEWAHDRDHERSHDGAGLQSATRDEKWPVLFQKIYAQEAQDHHADEFHDAMTGHRAKHKKGVR